MIGRHEAGRPPFQVLRMGRGLAAGDLDNDGRPDVVVVSQNEPVALFHNRTECGHFLTLGLEGTSSNRDAVGAVRLGPLRGPIRVAPRLGGGSYQSAGDPRLHFGLGDSRQVERVEVRWPSGRVNQYMNLAADTGYLIREGDPAARSPGRMAVVAMSDPDRRLMTRDSISKVGLQPEGHREGPCKIRTKRPVADLLMQSGPLTTSRRRRHNPRRKSETMSLLRGGRHETNGLSVTCLMALVAIVAIDTAVIPALQRVIIASTRIGLFSALAMAIFLAICLVIVVSSLVRRGEVALSPVMFLFWWYGDAAPYHHR